MGPPYSNGFGSRFCGRSTRSNRNFNIRNNNQWNQRRWYRGTREWRRKDEIVSIFVNNIDSRTTNEMLRSQFEQFGDVCDIFISRKRRAHNPKLFGFAKMKGPTNAFRAIKNMRGRWIDNSRIFVKEARFKKQFNKDGFRFGEGRSGKSEVWAPISMDIPRRLPRNPSADKLKPMDEEKRIKVKVNPTIVEELERSLIGESDEPRAVEVLCQTLTNQWSSITKVRDLGPYKFIVTFLEKEDMEHAISTKKPLLMQYFSHICPWDIYQQGDTRSIWLEVMGILPQVWSRDTCEKIANNFGILVCCDSSFEGPDSFITCRMMIDTNIMSYIAEVVYLSIDEQCIEKSIFVREGLNLTTCYIRQPEPKLNLSSHQWDDTLSVNNHGNSAVHESEGNTFLGNLDIVAETPRDNVQPTESEKTVTVVGNVNYDINEEMTLLAMRKGMDAQLEKPKDSEFLDDDCPPGFQKILNGKKFKRKFRPSIKANHKNISASTKKATRVAEDRILRDEIAYGGEVNLNDDIEPWSEDDFDTDPSVEELKT